jgi:uncharacterized protein
MLKLPIAMRTVALLEVAAIIILRSLGTRALLASPLWDWQMRLLGHGFFHHALFVLIPLVWLLIARRDLVAYGLSFRLWRQDLRAALSVFLPVAVVSSLAGFVPYTRWQGALILAAGYIALLFLVGWMLNRKLHPLMGVVTLVVCVLLFAARGFGLGTFPGVGQAISSLLYYAVFVGFGEEILYRGFVQSRLDASFGRPWRFLGAEVGWGLIITSLVFGFLHVLNRDMTTGQTWFWWWGLWTTCSGFFLGYVRARTGSIVAPAILHGLLQGLAAALMGA